ncbi:hypothetical protein GCM10010129_58030 [Streptomyces fumigatiscleroticus]|nr:hypothetical protein GCM10010129_58030 [Streptomyces fumigatiscleroticus]
MGTGCAESGGSRPDLPIEREELSARAGRWDHNATSGARPVAREADSVLARKGRRVW